MTTTSFIRQKFKSVWDSVSETALNSQQVIYLTIWGFLVGMATGTVISIFRILSGKMYHFIRAYTSAPDPTFGKVMLFLLLCLIAALITGFLIRNPAIRGGGAAWEISALTEGQPHPWKKILLPKFIGSWLVMAMGISVGREGPCIQMGAATALGLENFNQDMAQKRRFFILGGCSAGLASAFSAPFAGIPYVYEVMRQKIDPVLFTFMLAGSFGVFVSQIQIFGLGLMLPFGQAIMPTPLFFFWLVPLGICAGLTGCAYALALQTSLKLYARQTLLSPCLRPVIVFLSAGIMLFVFPAVTGEGLSIFSSIKAGEALLGYLCFFLAAKLLFTAFCYGSGIPAGVMVPVLCVGGVTGGIFADLLLNFGLISHNVADGMIVMGMAGAFASAERAPVTALLLVLEMTGAWNLAPGMLLVVAIAVICARLLKVDPV